MLEKIHFSQGSQRFVVKLRFLWDSRTAGGASLAWGSIRALYESKGMGPQGGRASSEQRSFWAGQSGPETAKYRGMLSSQHVRYRTTGIENAEVT